MRCPLCGTEGTEKYCLNCGRLLKCQACGAFSDGNFCGICGKPMTQEALSFKLKRSVKNFRNDKAFYYYGATFLVVIIAFAFYLIKPSNVDTNTSSSANIIVPTDIAPENTTSSDEKVTQVEDSDKVLFDAGVALIEQNKFGEAFEKLRNVPANSAYYPDAQAKIDELLIPLAEVRLKDAKKLFEDKNYQKAYETLQQAYGTATPPPAEILNLLPLYEKMATGQVTSDSNPLNISVTPNSSNSQFTNSANWTKAPNDTTSVDWLAMSESQKQNIVQTVLISWNNAGKKVLKDSTWFVSSVDSFYKSGNEQYMLDKAMDIVAVGGMAIESSN
jgi:hypothetical protein